VRGGDCLIQRLLLLCSFFPACGEDILLVARQAATLRLDEKEPNPESRSLSRLFGAFGINSINVFQFVTLLKIGSHWICCLPACG
jgi:hypothetical protein